MKDTTTTRDKDQKYLDELVATCEQKASDFESRQQLRAEEVVAVKKAIEIISSDKVKGTLTSTSQSGLRKPHLLSPSFAVTCMTQMVSYLKEKHARKLDSR